MPGTLEQYDFFGPPEPVTSTLDKRGRNDDAPVPAEREHLWPLDLCRLLGADTLERLYGDIPRRTRLYVKEVCRRIRCDSQHVYRLIQVGSLDATDIGMPGSQHQEWRIYRYSLVRWLFNRDFRDVGSRANVPPQDFEKIMQAVDVLREQQKEGMDV